jgi:hypothetical protein
MGLPRELHTDLVNPQIAAPVVVVAVPLVNSSTSTTTLVAFRAARRMRLIRATYHQSANTAGTSFTAQLKNANGPVNMSAALDIAALGADEGADFTGIPTDQDAVLEDGEHLDVVFTASSGTTAPGLVSLLLEFQLLE